MLDRLLLEFLTFCFLFISLYSIVVSISISIVCMENFVLEFVKQFMLLHIYIMDSILFEFLIEFTTLSFLLMAIADAR